MLPLQNLQKTYYLSINKKYQDLGFYMIKCPHCKQEFDANMIQRDVIIANTLIVFLVFSCPICKTYLDVKYVP